MSSAILWRIIIAVIVVALLFALLPPVFSILGFAASAAVMQVIQICIGGIAVLYVLTGKQPIP